MGFRFRQVFRVLPGLRLNASKGGISASLGVPGATANLSKKGIRGTVGIPGSGASYSKMLMRTGSVVPSPAPRATERKRSPEENCDPLVSQTIDEAWANLYLLTAHLVVENAKASTSWLQRTLRIGYSDAAELIAQLEADGIVSSPDWVGRREVLVDVRSLPELPD